MGIKELSIGRKDVFMVDPHILVEEEGWNARKPRKELDEHIRQLANSIKRVGVLEPLTVYLKNEQLMITSGHCRRLATLLAIKEGADIRAIPVRTEEKGSNDADRTLSLLTRNEGLPLTPLEKSDVVKRLLGYGWAMKEIIEKTGYSQSYINNLLELAESDPELLKYIQEGTISATTALNAKRELGEKGAMEAIEKAKEQNIDKPENKMARVSIRHLNSNKKKAKDLANKLGIHSSHIKASSKEEDHYSLILKDLSHDDVKSLVELAPEFFKKMKPKKISTKVL